MGATILVCLGAGGLERYGEKQLIHAAPGVKMQPLLQETWAVCLGTGHRVESGAMEGLLFLHTFYSTAQSLPEASPWQDDEAPLQVKLPVISQQHLITEMRKMLKLQPSPAISALGTKRQEVVRTPHRG